MAGMLFAASCAKDAGTAAPSDNQTAVTFNVGLDHAISSRAISEGKSADQLNYAVFNAKNEMVGDVEETALTSGKATVSIALVKGETYTVAFWAQNSACEAYDLKDFPTVKVSYADAVNNDDSRDAFYNTVSVKAGESNQPTTVQLKRPFAQINFGVKELEETIAQSSMKAEGVANELNLLSKTASGNVTAEFAAAACPDETLKEEYTWLSMSYVLVPAEGTTLDLTFAFDGTEREKIENVSAKVNYRTNLLASNDIFNAQFDVEVTPGFEGYEDVDDIPFEGEGEENEPTISVENLTAVYNAATKSIDFSATYTGTAELTSAAFQYRLKAAAAAALARAEEEWSSVEVEDLLSNELKASAEVSEAGDYEYQVVINGEVAAAGSDETPEVTVPKEEETPTPEAGTTPENPFTVAQAIAKAQETGETPTTESYYIKGLVASVTEQFTANFGNATFNMIDKDAPQDIFIAYRVYYKADNQKWTEGDDLVNVGDEVIIYGQIVNYKSNTPETQQYGYLYDIVTFAPTIDSFEVEYNEDANTATFTATYTNKSELSLKAGFKYTGTDLEKTVDMESVSGGTFTTTISTADLTPGKYTVTAFLNDVVSIAKSFTIKDPSGDNEPKEYVDVLDLAFTDASAGSTSYSDWSDKSGSASEAVYAGRNGGGNSSIQLNSTNPSGIVSTTSGGTVKKVVVKWNSSTTPGRTLDIYGNNTAYTSGADLYSTSTRGTKIGSIVYGTSTELEISGDYQFIGLRSNSSAMYIEEIQITWEN